MSTPPSVWQLAPDDAALRRYAAVLVHEATHVYLDTDDEAACNAEMRATETLLAETGGRRHPPAPRTRPVSAR